MYILNNNLFIVKLVSIINILSTFSDQIMMYTTGKSSIVTIETNHLHVLLIFQSS